jgi:predicted phage-related endonuclease
VCVLYKGTTLRLFVYQRDDETLSQIHDAIMDFQRRIDKYLTNDEIEWYDMQSSDEASRVFDDAEKTTIDLPDVEPLAEQILTLREEITDKENQIDALQIRIMDEMRDNQYAHSGRYKISWPLINYKAQPEKYTPPRPARTVRQSKLRIRDREDFS